MRAWLFMLGGMIVWAFHFFSLYIVASIFGSTGNARLLAGLLTAISLVADAVLLMVASRVLRGAEADEVGRWAASLALLTAGLSLVAVVWQGLPAAMV